MRMSSRYDGASDRLSGGFAHFKFFLGWGMKTTYWSSNETESPSLNELFRASYSERCMHWFKHVKDTCIFGDMYVLIGSNMDSDRSTNIYTVQKIGYTLLYILRIFRVYARIYACVYAKYPTGIFCV